MTKKDLVRFIQTKDLLIARKLDLEQELAAIDSALGKSPKKVGRVARDRRPARHRNYGELTTAVRKILASGPKNKKEIIDALRTEMFPFHGSALDVLDSVIYTKHFTRNGKLFSLANPA